MNRRSIMLGLPLLAAGAAMRAADVMAPLERLEFVAPHMGTLFRIVLYANDPARAKIAADSAFARIAELDQTLSDYQPDSELVRLSRQPPGAPIVVSNELFDLLALSQRFARTTDGAFDVTVGPMVRLWRESRTSGKLPSVAARATATGSVGHEKLSLNAADHSVTLAVSGMQLDLGGIAKGYAADAALTVLARQGFRSAMVAASGDIALGTAPPGAAGWTVEIASPLTAARHRPHSIIAVNVGISTSGAAEQFFEIAGHRYSHIIDRKAGLGVTQPLTVTAIARSAAWSDGIATAFSVRGCDDATEAQQILGRLDQPIRVIFQDERHANSEPIAFGKTPVGLLAGLS